MPTELETLPRREQFDEFTSETAKRMARFLPLSPKQIDHIMRTGLGWELISAADMVLNKFVGEDEDPRVVSLAENLKMIQETVAPDQVERERRNFLNALTPEMRKRVLEEERKPEQKLPFVEGVARRFYRRQGGGELYRIGLEKAAGKAKLSVEQTRQAGAVIGQVAEELFAEQQRLDMLPITTTEWREQRRVLGAMWQGAVLTMRTQFPGAAQAATPRDKKAFYDMVYSIAGLVPDRRTKGQLLYAAWQAIVPEVSDEGLPDMDTFFAARDEFARGLTPEDRGILDEERRSRMTPMEWSYDQDMDIVRPYWELRDRYLRENPLAAHLEEQLRRAQIAGNASAIAMLKGNRELREMRRFLANQRRALRAGRPDIDARLRVWGFVDTSLTPQAEALYGQISRQLRTPVGLPETVTAAAGQ